MKREEYESSRKNIYLPRLKNLNVRNFTSDFGIKARRLAMPLIYKIINKTSNYDINIENYPKLEKDKPYIFTPNHGFADDIEITLATLDRNAYVLMGSIDQVNYNPELYGAYLNGMIVMDIMDKEKRKEAYQKMLRILNSGTSILMYPEGSWNVSENNIVNPLYYGPYHLNQDTGCKVVPVSIHKCSDEKTVYINFDDPIDFKGMDKEEATNLLRDRIATMKYEQIEKYEKPVRRSELGKDPRLDFLNANKDEVTKSKWGVGDWEAEYLRKKTYKESFYDEYDKILEKVNVNHKNVHIFAKDIVLSKERKKYDFINFLYENLHFTRSKK